MEQIENKEIVGFKLLAFDSILKITQIRIICKV